MNDEALKVAMFVTCVLVSGAAAVSLANQLVVLLK